MALTCACGQARPSEADAGTGEEAGNTGDASVVVVDADTDGGPDGGSADGMLDGGCPYSYCEDFEAYPVAPVTDGEILGPWRVSNRGPAGSLASVDEVKPRTGTKSLHITVPASTQGDVSLSQVNGLGLVPGNDLYGRLAIFFTSGGTYEGSDAGFGLPLHVHDWVFTAAGYKPDGGTEGINLQYGNPKVAIAYSDPISIVGGAPTAGEWHCLQWQLDGSTPSDVANLWLDGTLIATGDAARGWSFPMPWNQFTLGFTHLQTLLNPVEVFLDDFALGAAMIPCP